MNWLVGTSTLPPMWPHFFSDGELVLEVHARGARLDHRLHQLERVERAAEARFGIGDDRREPVALVALPSAVVDLVGAQERLLMPRTTCGTLSTG